VLSIDRSHSRLKESTLILSGMELLSRPLNAAYDRPATGTNLHLNMVLQYLIDSAAIVLLLGGILLYQDIGELTAVGAVSLAFVLALWGETRKRSNTATEH
jgi:hypothetical protein